MGKHTLTELCDKQSKFIDENVKKHLGVRLVSILVTAIAIFVFVLTEDMSLPMQFVDEYTIWMAVILIAQLIVTVLSKKKYTLRLK